MMIYVPTDYCVTEEELNATLRTIQEDTDVKWFHLLMVDYVYHHQDPNYHGGLSFLDRLNKKIGRFNPEWDIPLYKALIESSNDRETTYIQRIQDMLSNPEHMAYYGI